MTAVSDSNNYAAHERAARALEAAFGLEAVQGVHSRERDKERPERRPDNWETFRGHESGIDPQAVKAELSALWSQADSGKAFAAALEERGYVLCKGDRRDFCVVDQAGDVHSLARRLEGVKAKDIRERLADVDRETLPSTAEARALVEAREEAPPPTADQGEKDGRNNVNTPQPPTADELAPQRQEEPTAEAAPIDRYATALKQAMREEATLDAMSQSAGVSGDGLTWWERVVAFAAAAALLAEAFAWVKGHWQDLVDRARGSATPQRDDPGRER